MINTKRFFCSIKKKTVQFVSQSSGIKIGIIPLLLLFTIIFTNPRNCFGEESNNHKIDSLYSIFHLEKNDSIKAEILFNIASFYESDKPDSAISILKRILNSESYCSNDEMFYKTSTMLASTYKYVGHHIEAIATTISLLEYFEKQAKPELVAKILIDLGERCRAAQQYKSGILYIFRAISIEKEHNLSEKLCSSYNRLAAIYYELKEFEVSKTYVDSSIFLCNEIGYDSIMPSNLDILGAIYSTQKSYKKAIKTYHNALQINQKTGNHAKENITIFINISRAFYHSKQYDSAIIYANKAVFIAEKYSIFVLEENADFLLSEIHYDTEKYKDAYDYLLLAMKIRHKIYGTEKSLVASELNTKYQTKKQTLKIKTQELLLKKEKKHKQLFLISVALLVVIVIIVLLFIKSTKQKNRELREKNRELNRKNEEIAIQHEKLQIVAKELKKTNNIKDRFFSIIAHDLKSPFNALLGLSELLTHSMDEFNEKEVKNISKTIYKSSHQAFDLLINLLEWSRTQTNDIKYSPKNININDIITTNINLFKNQANSKSLKIVFHPQKNIFVYADSNMVNTIMRNLISNSIKFTAAGHIKIDVNESQNYCSISVEDSGFGISSENLKKLFQLDKNVSTEGTNGETGTGLGLLLCEEFVKKNGGELFVKSTVNKGSVFSFTLPVSNNPESK